MINNQGQTNPLRQNNLLNQTPSSFITGLPTEARFYKQIFLDILILITAFLTGWFYLSWINGGNFWPVFICLSLFYIFSIFESLINSIWRRFGVILLEVILILLPFYLQHLVFNYYLLWAILILVFFFAWGEASFKNLLNNNLEIKFFSLAKKSLSKITTAFILAALILSIPTLYNGGEVNVSQSIFDFIYQPAVNVIGNLYQEINLNGTYGDFVSSLVKYQLRSNPKFITLPLAEQNVLYNQSLSTLSNQISNQLGMNFSSTEPMANVFRSYVGKVLTDWHNRYGIVFSVAWIIIFYLIIRSFMVIYYELMIFIGYIIYQILLAIDFLRISSKNSVQEILEY